MHWQDKYVQRNAQPGAWTYACLLIANATKPASACQRATGRFNLDDFRAKIGQGFGGKRPGNQLAEFKNFESDQRASGPAVWVRESVMSRA